MTGSHRTPQLRIGRFSLLCVRVFWCLSQKQIQAKLHWFLQSHQHWLREQSSDRSRFSSQTSANCLSSCCWVAGRAGSRMLKGLLCLSPLVFYDNFIWSFLATKLIQRSGQGLFASTFLLYNNNQSLLRLDTFVFSTH